MSRGVGVEAAVVLANTDVDRALLFRGVLLYAGWGLFLAAETQVCPHLVLQTDVFEEAVLLTFGFLSVWVGHDEISDLASVCVDFWCFFVEILHFLAFGLLVEIDLFGSLRKIVVLFLGWFRCGFCIFVYVIWIDGLFSVGIRVETSSSNRV